MSVPLFLLNLPFLLLFLLVLCGRKKKKSSEEIPQTPVKTSTTSKPSKVSNEPEKEAPLAPKKEEPIELKEEETQETSEEREIKRANVILSIYKDFEEDNIITSSMGKNVNDREYHMRYWVEDCCRNRIERDYPLANEAYTKHKCKHPEKNKNEDEKCDVCKHYIGFLAIVFKDHLRIVKENTLLQINEDLYDYAGKLPIVLENREWLKVKEQLTKELGPKMKLAPPAGTSEERKRQIDEGFEKLCQIIRHIDYWNSSDDDFRQRIAKDFEKTRQIYRKHDCRGLLPDKGSTNYYCHVCSRYVDERWTGRLYEEVLKNEKRFPDGMKRQLEEDFYFHQQNFEKYLPLMVENRYWIWVKERIVEERAKKETEKKQEKAKNDGNKAKDGSRQI